MKNNIFGYKHLHFIFRPEFEIKDDSLFYKGRHVNWREIEKVKIFETLLSALEFRQDAGVAHRGKRTIVTLQSGEEIHIRCDLTAKNAKPQFRISALSDEYKLLRDFIIVHVPQDKIEGKATK
jgi:hypothetical protein